MYNEIHTALFNRVNPAQVITSIAIAFLCGLIISYTYRKTETGPNSSVNFIKSLIILSMITAIVMIVIGNNLARAFGLVGAMSIIRFRTAIKDIHDIVYIFFSLAIGLAAGTGLYSVAFIGTFMICVSLFILSKINVMHVKTKEMIVQFTYTGKGVPEKPYLTVFNKYCTSADLINVKSLGEDNETLEISYYVKLKKKEDAKLFVAELKRINGVGFANLLFDAETF